MQRFSTEETCDVFGCVLIKLRSLWHQVLPLHMKRKPNIIHKGNKVCLLWFWISRFLLMCDKAVLIFCADFVFPSSSSCFCHLQCSRWRDIRWGNPCCVLPDLVSIFISSKTNGELERDDFSVFLVSSYSSHKKSTLSKR